MCLSPGWLGVVLGQELRDRESQPGSQETWVHVLTLLFTHCPFSSSLPSVNGEGNIKSKAGEECVWHLEAIPKLHACWGTLGKAGAVSQFVPGLGNL